MLGLVQYIFLTLLFVGCSSGITSDTQLSGTTVKVINLNSLNLVEGDGNYVGTSYLIISKSDLLLENNSEEITYTIRTSGGNGQLYHRERDKLLGVGDSFNQSDVNNNDIEYRYQGAYVDDQAGVATDYFGLEVAQENGQILSETQTLNINVATFCSGKFSATAYNTFGSGTVSDPYFICSSAQFNDIGANSAAWNAHFVLRSSIDLAGLTGTDYNVIGSQATPFSGSFDGNNNTISNFTYIEASTSYVGIFGYVKTDMHTIKNLKVVNANVTGLDRVGVLIGHLETSRVQNISVKGSLLGRFFSGSVIGHMQESAGSYLQAELNLSGTESVGGIAGYVLAGELENVFFKGSVTAANNRAGGIVGNFAKGHLSNCYSIGDVNGDIWIGGLVGNSNASTKINDCFVSGNTTGNSGTDTTGLTFGFLSGAADVLNIYFDSSKTCTNVGAGGSCNATELNNPINLVSLPDYYFNKNNPPLSFWDFDNDWSEAIDDYPKFKIALNSSWTNCEDHLNDIPFAGGVGSPANPYLICTAAQFNRIGASTSYLGKHFVLKRDIDFDDLVSTYNIIGDSTNPFYGSISGNGFKLRNLTINVPASDKVGLVGVHYFSFLDHLILENVNIIGRDAVGSIVGDKYSANSSFILYKASVSGSVQGNDSVGGVAGNCKWSHIINTHSSASVQGTTNVGGLVGAALYDGRIINSYNSGSVSGDSLVGGIAGVTRANFLLNSFNVGSVVGTGSDIGPIYGSNPQVNQGFSNMFYDNQVNCSGCDNTIGTGIDTSAQTNYFYQTSNTPLDQWNFTDVWLERADNFPVFR